MKPSLLPGALLAILAASFMTAGQAKLPPPSDEAKAKAAEAAAKAAWAGKVAGYQLCKVEDRLAAAYFANAKRAGKTVGAAIATPPCADPGPFQPPS